jgi:hypothetical protein
MITYQETERQDNEDDAPVVVCLEDIGEGIQGEYNEDDPNDMPLLRFTVFKDHEAVEDSSYCTQLNVDTITEEQATRALNIIMEAVYDKLQSGDSVKRTCEQLSWLEMGDVKNDSPVYGMLKDID